MFGPHRIKAGTLVLSLGLIGAVSPLLPAKAQGVAWGGFIGSYQSGVAGVTAPVFTRRDTRIDFAFGGQGPGGSTSPEFATSSWANFSASWSGSLIATTSETYSFRVASSDAVSLYIRPTGTTTWTTLFTDWAATSKVDAGSYPLVAG